MKRNIAEYDSEKTESDDENPKKTLAEEIAEQLGAIKNKEIFPDQSKIYFSGFQSENLMHILLEQGKFDKVEKLIRKFNANIHLENSKHKTLLQCVLNVEYSPTMIDQALRLIRLGANINDKNEAGQTLIEILNNNNAAEEIISELTQLLTKLNEIIHVFSLDADGCLYNLQYTGGLDIVNSNNSFH